MSPRARVSLLCPIVSDKPILDRKAARAELTRRKDSAATSEFTWQRPSGKSECPQFSNGHAHSMQNTGLTRSAQRTKQHWRPWQALAKAGQGRAWPGFIWFQPAGRLHWVRCRSWRGLALLIDGSGLTKAWGPQEHPLPMRAWEHPTWVLDRLVASPSIVLILRAGVLEGMS
jgi:hypothetical protein